jgi:hypothetical protein
LISSSVGVLRVIAHVIGQDRSGHGPEPQKEKGRDQKTAALLLSEI